MENTYETVQVPRLKEYNEENQLSRDLAQKARNLRLHALRTSPDAFASSYEDEVSKDLTHTLERLGNPNATHFFAIDRATLSSAGDREDEDALSDLLSSTFVGSIVLIGPVNDAKFTAKKDAISAISLSSEGGRAGEAMSLDYILNGTFVDPNARRAGIGRSLMEAAIAAGQRQAFDQGLEFRCRVLVDSENQAAKQLYERAGFLRTGEESYTQKPRQQMGEMRAEQRIAIKLELRRACRREGRN